ncbi:MAG: cytochrome c5 [Halioglobus sp.]|jgi:cytochrome c5
MKKILAVALLLGTAGAFADPVTDKYSKSCAVCHTSGAAGAPVSHDIAAWAPRMAKGMDALVASVTTGLNAMPPKGMCFDCTADDYKAMIEFMSKPAE